MTMTRAYATVTTPNPKDPSSRYRDPIVELYTPSAQICLDLMRHHVEDGASEIVLRMDEFRGPSWRWRRA